MVVMCGCGLPGDVLGTVFSPVFQGCGIVQPSGDSPLIFDGGLSKKDNLLEGG